MQLGSAGCGKSQVIGYATLGGFARACLCLVWRKGTNFIWIKELEMTGYNLICDTALRICEMSLWNSPFSGECVD